MKINHLLTLAVITLLSLSCTLVSRAIGVSEAHILLSPVTSNVVSAEVLSTTQEILQTRMRWSDLSGRASVSVQGEFIRIDLTNRDDIGVVTDVSVKQGVLIFFDTDSSYQTGSRVPENPRIIVSDLDIHAVSVVQDQLGHYMVALEFTDIGGQKLAEYTKNNIGRFLVIALDGIVFSSPIVNSEIPDGEAVIQGNFTKGSADQLALSLRSGRLPFPLEIIEIQEEE